MARRLARRQRSPASKGLRLEKRGPQIPAQEAHRNARSKKRTTPSTAEGLARGWQAASPPDREAHRVARELADNLHNHRGPISASLIAGILARWRATYAYNTIRSRTQKLKRMLREIDRKMDTNLAELLPRTGKQRARLRILQPGELDRLYQHATPHMRLFLILGLQAGLRFAEILRVGPAGHDAAKQTVTIRVKGGAVRTIALPFQATQLIALAPQIEGASYIECLRGRKCTPQRIREDWNRLTKKAACPDLNPHDLRRTAAVHIYRETNDVFAAKALLGHADLATTAHYLKAHEATLAPIAEATWTPKGRVQ
ncbi:MAG TPA: tyrosine-type recombinase/integrase [Verrucomicrobiae bacterium]|nr:tyrosine-type recombinase/integrase [Verrucomicrobiae bacterium]